MKKKKRLKEIYNKKSKNVNIKNLKHFFHGNFGNIKTGLFYTSIDYDYAKLRKFFQGLGTDKYTTLVEILC